MAGVRAVDCKSRDSLVEIKPNMAEVSGNLRIVHNRVIFGHLKKLNPKPVNNSSIYFIFIEVICCIVSKENELLTQVLAFFSGDRHD
jgi:hypothetical protein